MLIKIRLFGPFQLWKDEELIPSQKWPTHKSLDLFKLLVTNRGHTLSKDYLCDQLWPELNPNSAMNSLRVAVHQIRRILEIPQEPLQTTQLILTYPNGYSFNLTQDCWVDCDAFLSAMEIGSTAEKEKAWGPAIEAYQAADILYRGPFLEENLYDEWSVGTRQYYLQLILDLLGRLTECQLKSGHFRQALTSAQKALRMDPVQEHFYRLEMASYYLLGQRDQALQTYETCRVMLDQQVGIDPMPETRQLHLDILQEKPIFLENIPTIPNSTSQPGQETGKDWIPFTGREKDLVWLHDQLTDCLAFGGRMVLVKGETGIGKTRLVSEFVSQAIERGARTAQAQALPDVKDLPYQLLRDAFRHYLLHQLNPEQVKVLLGPWVEALCILLPEISQIVPCVQPKIPESPEIEKQLMFDGLTGFFLELAQGQPLVIFIDDIQWCDGSTLSFLAHLLNHTHQVPVMLIGACQIEEVQPGDLLSSFCSQLERRGFLATRVLENLSREAVRQIITIKFQQHPLPSTQLEQIEHTCEGNPFFLAETLRGMVSTGTAIQQNEALWEFFPKLQDGQKNLPISDILVNLVNQRTKCLSEGAVNFLRIASVIGRIFSLDLVRAVTEWDKAGLVDVIDELTSHYLIREHLDSDRIRYGFRHDLVRQVVYDQMSATRRSYLHLKVGEALERATRRMDEPAHLAYHFSRSGDATRAIPYWIMAGDVARELNSQHEALTHYQNAILALQKQKDPASEARLWMKIGQVRHINYQFNEAQKAFETGFSLWQRSARLPAKLRSSGLYDLKLVSNPLMPLDPGICGHDDTNEVLAQIFAQLVERTPELDILPDVATRWEISEGGRKYVFHLRSDARWSDGLPVQAEDFEFAWRRILSPGSEMQMAVTFFDIAGAEDFFRQRIDDPSTVGIRSIDHLTLEIVLEQPNNYFLHHLATSLASPIPRHIIEKHGTLWSKSANLVSNGPFCLVSELEGKHLRFSRNPYYHGTFPGNISEVELVIRGVDDQCLQEYEEGILDGVNVWKSPGELEKARLAFPDDYLTAPSPRITFIAFNLHRSPFNDERVRKAFVMATDRERLAFDILKGYSFPGTGGLIPPGIPGHGTGIGLSFNPGQARTLLQEAGYPGGRGFPVVLCLQGGSGEPGEYLSSQWVTHLGVKTEWRSLDWTSFFQVIQHEMPDLFVLGFGAGLPDPDQFINQAVQWPDSGWRDEQYTAWIEAANHSGDLPTRIQICQKIDQYLSEKVPRFPLTYGRWHLLIKPCLKSFPISPLRRWFWKEVVKEDV